MKELMFICFFVLVLGSCSSGEEDKVKMNDPESVVLFFPENNSECIEGHNISDDESTVTFQWETSKFTDTYEISIRNLVSGNVKKYTSSNTSIDITIDRGIPYSWFVTSRSKATVNTAESDVWRFYNAGAATISYIPFPAEAVEPHNKSSVSTTNGIISLKWVGNDLDNDISSYDVYFGVKEDPEIFQNNVTTTQLEVNVVTGSVYYWKIETKDREGNVSGSEIFSFSVI